MDFPKRIYTEEEVNKARELIEKGYKHSLRAEGSPAFKQKVKRALKLVKAASYYDFLRTYIRKVEEIDGLTQLRQAEAAIWANMYAVENPVDAASLFVQKANHMKEYLEGKLYYGGAAEKRSDEKRIEFLKVLKTKSQEEQVREECERILNLWRESYLVY
ncbi:MAG: hypothetical protein ABSF24_01585 [Candidatus Bathyarchaeia archaeon]